jgi:hypothetical protein
MTKRPKLPKGYKVYDGKGCPVDERAMVDCIIRTGEGLGHSGVMRASLHDWAQSAPKGHGHVVAYRKIDGTEQIDTAERWDEKQKSR